MQLNHYPEEETTAMRDCLELLEQVRRDDSWPDDANGAFERLGRRTPETALFAAACRVLLATATQPARDPGVATEAMNVLAEMGEIDTWGSVERARRVLKLVHARMHPEPVTTADTSREVVDELVVGAGHDLAVAADRALRTAVTLGITYDELKTPPGHRPADRRVCEHSLELAAILGVPPAHN